MDVVQEELLHCSICMELFSDPRTLPCQHTFCRDCLTTYIDGKRKNTYSRLNAFDCPLCRKNVSLENYDSNGGSFPINLVVTSLLNINKPRRRYKATASLCDKACQTSKERRFLRNKFSQTKQMQSKEVAAQTTTIVKTTNKRTQTDTEKTKVSHIQPQAQKQNKTTQTDRNRLASETRTGMQCNCHKRRETRPGMQCNCHKRRETRPGMQCDCHNRPVSIWIFQFVGDKWDRVFFRGFDNLIEKIIIRYVILIGAADVAGCGAKEKLKTYLANLVCYICLAAYILLMLCLYAGVERQSYVFMIILLYKLARQAMTIHLSEYPGFSAKNGHFINILFVHVLWFWTMLLFLCLLLYTVCLLISVRGHPKQKTVCVTHVRDYKERCTVEVLSYPDILFLRDWSLKHFGYHLSQFLDLNFSEGRTLVNELFRHVVKGEAIIVKEEHLRMGQFKNI